MRIPKAFMHAKRLIEPQEASVLGMGPAGGPGWTILPCTMIKQEKTEWCWASVTQAVENRPSGNASQCDIARAVLGSGCPADCPDSTVCNKAAKLSNALTIRHHFDHRVSGKISFDDLKTEIGTNNRVIACSVDRGSVGHALVICGFSETTPGHGQIAILDPAPTVGSGPLAHDFDQFRVAYSEGGTWSDTCFTR